MWSLEKHLFSFILFFKRTKFTRLHVWTQYFYWPDQYPEGPDDKTCKIPLSKRNVTVTFDDDQSLLAYPDEQQ